MIKIILNINLLIYLVFFSLKVSAFSSSSYLIAKLAILSDDYVTASIKLKEAGEFDFENQMITFVNADQLENAFVIAKKIIDNDSRNLEAWMVILTHSRINNNLNFYKKFEEINDSKNFFIIDYLFYDNKRIQSNKKISNSFLSIFSDPSLNDLSKIENYKFVLFYLKLASMIDPSNDQVYFYQAQFFQQLEKFKQSEEIYNKINDDNALYLEAQINIAFNKKKIGLENDAEKILLNLYKSNQLSEYVMLSLADFYRSIKEYKKAINFYSKIINLEKDYKDRLSRIIYIRGICYDKMNNWNLAEKDFLFSLELNPNDPQVLNYLAYGWIEKNINIDQSISMLKNAIDTSPESHYILDSLAWAYFKKNKLNMALSLMEDAIEIAPGESISLDHLGDIYFALGRKREAYFMWKQALDLTDPEDEIIKDLESKIKQYNAG